jgi:hypothetical protein
MVRGWKIQEDWLLLRAHCEVQDHRVNRCVELGCREANAPGHSCGYEEMLKGPSQADAASSASAWRT